MKDLKTHSTMLIPIILGSDKTTVSVATGDNKYWPIYLSIANIHNNAHQAHCNSVVLSFLPIPKGKVIIRYSMCSWMTYKGTKEYMKNCTNAPASQGCDDRAQSCIMP